MRYWKGILIMLSIAALAGAANAQTPTIGVYFDPEGTQTSTVAPYGPAHTVTAYVLAMNTEQTVGGAAFKLELDPKITLSGATFPAGIQIGTLTDGIQIGMTDCYYGFYGQPVLLATLTLWTGTNFMNEAPLRILPYPPAGVIQLADCTAMLTNPVGGEAKLTVYPPTKLSVFWDTAGTQTNLVTNGGYDVSHTAYLLVVDSEQTVGGVSYKLDIDPRISLTGHTYPAGIQIGTPLEGIQVGMTDCYYGFYGQPVLISTLTFWTGNQIINDGYIDVVAYPPAGAIQLVDCQGMLRVIDGGRAMLNVVVSTEDKSWGEIKNLYER